MRIDENYFKTDNPMKQNSVEDILSEDETILQRLKPNIKVVILESIFKGLPFVLVWVCFDVFFIITIITTGAFNDNPNIAFMMIPFFAIHLLPCSCC